MSTAPKMTKTQTGYLNQMIAAMQRFEWDMHSPIAQAGRIPSAWRGIWERRTAKKQRVSLWVNADVVKFFRSLGPGYGPRMNDVLHAFMMARLAGLIQGEDLHAEARENWMGKAKPQVYEVMAEMERAVAGSEGVILIRASHVPSTRWPEA